MKIKATQFQQNGITTYTSVMKAKDVINKGEIDRWKPDHKEGYQRDISKSRAKEFSRFIRRKGAISPLSILINVRENVLKYNDGYLDIPDKATLWIVDGQHRIEGLKDAIEENIDYEEFDVPVIITNLESFEEATNFVIINKTQKGVRSDLAERFVHKFVKKLGVQKVQELLSEGIMKKVLKGAEWRPQAIDIVDNLNKIDGVWKFKIRSPNEVKADTIVRQKSFTDSLEPILKDDFFKRLDIETLTKILTNYWDALKGVIPEAFEDPNEYVIQKTTGVFVFNGMLPFISEYTTDKKGNRILTKDKFVEIFEHMGLAKEPDYWHVKGGDSGVQGAGTMGTSQKTFSQIREFIKGELSENLEDLTGRVVV